SGQINSLGQQAIISYFNNDIKQSKAYLEKSELLIESSNDLTAIMWFQLRKATLLVYFGEKEQAYNLLQKTLTQINKQGIKNPEVLGRLYNEMARATIGNNQEALEHMSKAVDYAKLHYGELSPIYQTRLKSKSTYLIALFRYDEAIQALNESSKIAEKLYSKAHSKYIKIIHQKAYIFHDLGQFNLAKEAYIEANDGDEKLFGINNRSYAIGINNLAYLYEDMGQLDLAEKHYRESIKIRRLTDPDNQILIASSESNLSRTLAKKGQFDKAEEILLPLLDVFTKHKKNNLYNDIVLASVTIRNGENANQCLDGLNKIETIITHLEKQSPKSWRRMYAELWIGEMYGLCGKKAEAHKWLDAALEKSKTIYIEGSDGQKLMAKRVKDLKS
ncbi:MAG: tetratricopeptide repeat protein, partial [Marinicellaceae bacterium]